MKELIIQCMCHGELLKVDKFEGEDEIYLTVFKYSLPSYSFLSRIKSAWKVLKGEGIVTTDLVLSKESFNKLREF